MKYMTFNSSCSYAGVANMLAQLGVDTDDRAIALGMKLPYLFAYEDGEYLAGPMLQSAKWFNLYLNPMGFEMVETAVSAVEVPEFLKRQKTAMLGIPVENAGKHAVVYTGMAEEKLHFLNNKWAHDPAPEELLLTAEELRNGMGDTAMVATLNQIPPEPVDLSEKIAESAEVLRQNYREICAVCGQEETMTVLRGKLNSLFRPLLLDGITMLNLLGETALAERFTAIQWSFLTALRQEGERRIRLADVLPMEEFTSAVACYLDLMPQ